jgi:hypothetical protein
MKKNAARYTKLNGKMLLFERIFRPFINSDFCFENKMVPYFMDQLSKEEKIIFNFHPKEINWDLASQLNPYGMQKFFYKMDSSLPNGEPSNIISTRS